MNAHKLKIFIISFLFLGLNSFAHAELSCSELARNIILSSKESRLTNLPLEHFNLSINKNTPVQIFELTRNNFNQKMQTIILDRNLVQLLDNLTDKEFINQLETNEDSYQRVLLNLKDIRKQASILRSVFVVFSEDHISPEAFENFTKKLGKLNDAIEFRAFHLVSKSAEKTKKSLEINAINKEIKKFKAAGPNSIKHTLKKIRNKILDQIKKDKMSTEEYHEIRKELKHYLTVTQVMLSLNRTDDLDMSFKFLTELNDKLGAERDNVLRGELSSTDHEVKKLENMSEDLKQTIRDFFQGLDININ
jgi:hypothetical protein